jgi:putative membrane protein
MADFGVLAHHMAVHIVAMNAAAPVIALFWHVSDPRAGHSASGWLWPAVALQLALLLGWHLPSVLAYAFASDVALAAMHLSLFIAALWFWLAVIGAAGQAAWRSLAALLVTGKIFCLAGALLAFAQRPLYPALGNGHHAPAPAAELLADQQLAGLFMLIACPLVYVLAGVLIAARWLSAWDAQPDAGIRRRAP